MTRTTGSRCREGCWSERGPYPRALKPPSILVKNGSSLVSLRGLGSGKTLRLLRGWLLGNRDLGPQEGAHYDDQLSFSLNKDKYFRSLSRARVGLG